MHLVIIDNKGEYHPVKTEAGTDDLETILVVTDEKEFFELVRSSLAKIKTDSSKAKYEQN